MAFVKNLAHAQKLSTLQMPILPVLVNYQMGKCLFARARKKSARWHH